ncbi:MAG TPA: HAMP domain-containing sensor histidine kinase [Cellvibrio sp.]|mgnify:CR=1 FL=1|nr:HAMP domain-containing sensor histidine kinase [Cellvibrio sp.]
MSHLFSGLCARLALAFVALFFLVGFAFFALTNWSNNRYYQEITQHLNKSLAMYIAQREPLIRHGVVNERAMKELGALVMVVNPIVEVYLLDTQGKILSHSVPADTIIRSSVTMDPIKTLLLGKTPYPITGDDPRSLNSNRVFSAFPITDGTTTAGYLYVILGGQTYQTLTQSLRSSYIVQQSLAGLAALTLFAIAGAVLIFAALTSPLRKLAKAMNEFQLNELKSPAINQNEGDEIQYLTNTFIAMRQRINDQLERLQETDRLRRELISNVSHDLRTPMSSMQGYLEMLMRPNITANERKNYIEIAYKHCGRLTQLVKELFELSKLDAGRISPQYENFSLAELLQDVAQKFSLAAHNKDITITTPNSSQLFMVNADIGLIERVLENLIDNALRYTPTGGRIQLSLTQQQTHVDVGIQDTGIGLTEEDIPHIFERYYRGQKPTEYQEQSTGLGLAIVKRILELHNSVISVESQLNQGTCFRFPLPVTQHKYAA